MTMSGAGESLRKIRALELEMGRRLDLARTAAGDRIAAAHQAAASTIEEATRRGRQEAEAAHEAAVAAAEAEAERIRAAGRDAAFEHVAQAEVHLDEAAGAVFDLLISPPSERGK